MGSKGEEVALMRRYKSCQRWAAGMGLELQGSVIYHNWAIELPGGREHSVDTLAEVDAFLTGFEAAGGCAADECTAESRATRRVDTFLPGGESDAELRPGAEARGTADKPRSKRKTRKQLKAALKRARRTLRAECARANAAESYKITLDGYKDALLAAQRGLEAASSKVKAGARPGFFHSEGSARQRAEAMGLSMRGCKRSGIFELTLPDGETYVCPACEMDVYLDGFSKALDLDAAAVPDLVAALRGAAELAARNICTHEETFRGGGLWEICTSCGAKWADDRGGRPKYVEPKELTAAYDVLARHSNGSGGDE